MFKNKKYWILMPPFLILGIVLITSLPKKYLPYSFLVALTFWGFYYLWVYLEKKNLTKK